MHTTKKKYGVAVVALLFSAAVVADTFKPQIRGLDRTGTDSGGSPNAVTAGSAAGSANLPLFSAAADRTVQFGTRTGNTLQVATWTGATTSGRCVEVDASGNLKVHAAACNSDGAGGGGNGFTLTIDTGADTATLTATRDVHFLNGRASRTVLSGETFTWDTPTGTSDYIIYLTAAGTMTLSSLTLSGVGSATTSSLAVGVNANASTGLQLPQGAILLYAGTVTSDNFVNTATNLWSSDAAPWVVAAGGSCTVTETNDYTITVDCAGSGGSGCTIVQQGVGSTTQSTSATSLADITIPALTVGDQIRVQAIFEHGAPRTNLYSMGLGFDAVANIFTTNAAAASRTWTSHNVVLYYTGTTNTIGQSHGNTDSTANQIALTNATNPDTTTNLSAGSKVLKLKGNLAAVDTTENIKLSSYTVEVCQ